MRARSVACARKRCGGAASEASNPTASQARAHARTVARRGRHARQRRRARHQVQRVAVFDAKRLERERLAAGGGVAQHAPTEDQPLLRRRQRRLRRQQLAELRQRQLQRAAKKQRRVSAWRAPRRDATSAAQDERARARLRRHAQLELRLRLEPLHAHADLRHREGRERCELALSRRLAPRQHAHRNRASLAFISCVCVCVRHSYCCAFPASSPRPLPRGCAHSGR